MADNDTDRMACRLCPEWKNNCRAIMGSDLCDEIRPSNISFVKPGLIPESCMACGKIKICKVKRGSRECLDLLYPSDPSHWIHPGAGVKADTEKLRYTLLNWDFMEKVVKVLEFGAKKYPAADNWKQVPNGKQRYTDAALRHLLAFVRGEYADPETGQSHLAHLSCCIQFLDWFCEQEKK